MELLSVRPDLRHRFLRHSSLLCPLPQRRLEIFLQAELEYYHRSEDKPQTVIVQLLPDLKCRTNFEHQERYNSEIECDLNEEDGYCVIDVLSYCLLSLSFLDVAHDLIFRR